MEIVFYVFTLGTILLFTFCCQAQIMEGSFLLRLAHGVSRVCFGLYVFSCKLLSLLCWGGGANTKR